MAESETQSEGTQPATQQEGEPKAEGQQGTPPLTREELTAALKEAEDRLRKELTDAASRAGYSAARREEAKSDTALREIKRLEAQIESLELSTLPEDQRERRKLERQLEKATASTVIADEQRQNETAWRDFQARGRQTLQQEGIAADDPRLTAAFQKYAQTAASTTDWDIALHKAIADVHKDNAKKASDDAKTAAERAREEERNKRKNEDRKTEGPTDKGSPSTQNPKDWSSASDKEVLEELERRRARRIRAGTG